MEAYYVMTYGAKSRSLPLLPPLFENNEAGGDFLAKEALDAVKDAEQKAAGIIACSAGNHAQGVAMAASHNGIKAVICMPDGAPISKIAAS